MNPWGPIIAAMIAGFIAFIGMIITKENKVSEFRQAWINEFREEISFLIEAYKKWAWHNKLYTTHLNIKLQPLDSEHEDPKASIQQLEYIETLKSHREKSQWYDQTIHDAKNEIERYKGRIKLRLNSDITRRKEPETNLNNLLDEILRTKNLESAEKLSDEIYLNSSLILSTEWRVVKRGEESYVKSKKFIVYIAISVALIATLGFIFHLEDALEWLMNNPPPLLID